MKIWTVTTDPDGGQTAVHLTKEAAEAQAVEIVAAWYDRHIAADGVDRDHSDWRESYSILCDTVGFFETITLEEHDISGHPDLAQKPDTELTAAYRAAAKKRANDDLEFDGNAAVSLGDDAGAWVAAWVWVPESELPAEFRDMED